MGQIMNSLASVCLCALLRLQVLFDFDEFCTVVRSPKSKIEFVWDSGD